MKHPEISVIVPVYDVEKYIHKCIESILAQKFSDFELILIDDGSPDNCPAICDAYALRDDRVKVIHKKNGGLSDARNVGLDIAKGQYIAFVDSDDYISEYMLEIILKYMKLHNCEIGFCNYAKVYNEEVIEEINDLEAGVITQEEAMRLIIADQLGSQVWRCIYKKALWDNVRFPVGRRFEDIATTYLTFYHAKLVFHIDKDLYFYTIRNNSTSYTKNELNAIHIYYGFKERFEFCKDRCPQLIDISLGIVVKHGINLLNAKILGLNTLVDTELENEISMLLNSERSNIRTSKHIAFKTKLEVNCWFIDRKLYTKVYKMLKGVAK